MSPALRKVSAILLFGALCLAVLLAGIARVAETPAAGAQGNLGRIAPGALGILRFELAKVGASRLDPDPDVAKLALIGNPLAGDPFAAFAAIGLRDDPRGQSGKEAALLAEALRRDPRSRPARILLLRQMAANGDLKGAFDQLGVFSRLNPGLVEAIMEAITSRISTEGQVDDALAAIKGHDRLYLPFVNRMTGKKKTPQVVLRLARGLPPQVLARPEIRRSVVRQLVDAGEYAVARQYWLQGGPRSPSGLVYSPDFAERKAPAPFNWQLLVGPTGAAEYARGGGLSVAYYDRNPGPLAMQLLTLPTGNYTAFADYDVIDGQVDNVRLRITCKGSGDTIGELPLTRSKAGINRIKLPFSVPGAGCTGQTLAIVGVPTEQRGEMQLVIKRIDVTRQGAMP